MILVLAVVRLIVVVLATVVAIYASLTLFQFLTPGIDEWQEVARGNVAAGLVMAGVAVAVAIILQPIIMLPLQRLDVGASVLLVAVLLEAVRVALGVVIAVATVVFSSWLYGLLTRRIEERLELQHGNIAIGLIQASVIVATAMLVSAPATMLVGAVLQAVFGEI
jgi:uncharacterized membrane protein YjfL (UPF0719 family)